MEPVSGIHEIPDVDVFNGAKLHLAGRRTPTSNRRSITRQVGAGSYYVIYFDVTHHMVHGFILYLNSCIHGFSNDL